MKTLVRMAIIKKLQVINSVEDVEKRESLYTAGGNLNWCNHYGQTIWSFFKKLKIEPPYDPVISLLGR